MTKPKILSLLAAIIFSIGLALPAEAQVTVTPDCVLQGTFTATGRQGGPTPATRANGFNNKTAGCITWYLSVTVTGFSATSIALQSAPDSAGVAGSWVNFAGTIVYGTNPTTTTTQTGINATGFYPWISVNAATLTGSGTVTWSLVGWKGAPSFAVSVGPPVGTTDVNCVMGCAGGTTDTDDGTVAGGQSTSLQIGLPYVWNGSGWVRMLGNATDGLLVNLGANNDVTVTSSGLPTGASTSANQSTVIGALGSTTVDKCSTTDTTAASLICLTKELSYLLQTATGLQSAANSNSIVVALSSANGCTNATPIEVAANDNHATVVTGAHMLCDMSAFNIGDAQFLRLYDAAAGFNGCGSATGLVWEGTIPGSSTTGAGFVNPFPMGRAFASGISICVTGDYGKTDTTNAIADTTAINISYK